MQVKVWTHFFIGDTEGNNKWLAEYPGNKEGVKQPYPDCKCQYDDLSNPNPICTYWTLDHMRFAKRRTREDEDAGKEYKWGNNGDVRPGRCGVAAPYWGPRGTRCN